MIINFMLSILGFLIIMRTFYQISDEFGLSKQFSSLITGCLMVVLALALLFLHSRALMLWILIGIIWISFNFAPIFLRLYLMKSMKKQLIPLLDQIILGLQVGQSFRVSFLQAIEAQRSWFRHQLFEIYNSMVSTDVRKSSRTKFLDELIAEFCEIDRSKNKIIDQLRAFRRQIKTEEDFRRKSGQVTQQIRLQAIIVTVMYVSLLVFVAANFGFQQNLHLILYSATLFLLGLAWIFSVGRKMKWKV